MAKKALLTVGGVYRKNKKAFATVNGVYRKIRKAYVTIGGVYRPCWSGEVKILYYGTAPDLKQAVSSHAGISFKDYAIFAGGRIASAASQNIDYYKGLTRANSLLSTNRYGLKGVALDDSVVIGAGGTYGEIKDAIDILDNQITVKATLTDMVKRTQYGAAKAGNAAIFAGGHISLSYDTYTTSNTSVVTAIKNGSLHDFGEATVMGGFVTGTNADDVAVFVGGANNSGSKCAGNIYTSSGTKSILPAVPEAVMAAGATPIGRLAVFAGGVYDVSGANYDHAYNTVFSYNSSGSLTISNSALSAARGYMAATTLEEIGMFAGGRAIGTTITFHNNVDCVDSSLTVTQHAKSLPSQRAFLEAASADNLAYFAGGRDSGNNVIKAVEVYQITY